MPYYTFIDKTTGEEFEHMLSISEREVFIQKNPHLTQKLTTPAIGDPVRQGITKTPDGFQQLLNNARTKNKDSTIQSRY